MDYEKMNGRLSYLFGKETDPIANLANASAVLMEHLPRLNWAGFYLFKGEELVLGPFQGKPACVRIKPERGVCGAAFTRNETVRVPDVHAFPGHIACDSASNSEIVIPLRKPDGTPFGVMDLDSPDLERFSEEDQKGLEEAARIIERAIAE
ncbi:MAG: GAF domain-containing protein [Clostridia bacterium]|nr:GAF domain-containing protein [Clostridia bacterium]MBR0025626.1 GAF domain-containing protein [Clostridia bacterium]